LAEVELDLTMPNEAKQHLEECRELAGQLAKYIESNKNKLKVPSTVRMEKRIDSAMLRLEEDHGSAFRLSKNGPRASQP
jgi:hypothetical protein